MLLNNEEESNELKYEMIPSNNTFNDRPLYRIRALKSFGDVKKWAIDGFDE